MSVTRLRPRGPTRSNQLELALALVDDAQAAGLWEPEAAGHARAVFQALRATVAHPRGFRFVKVDMARMAEVMQALRDLTDSRPMEALAVLYAMLEAAGWEDQWAALTQAQVAAKLAMRPTNVSRAVRALSHPTVLALVASRPVGRTVQWEIDARLASRLPENAHRAAIARQARERDPKKSTPLRAVPL